MGDRKLTVPYLQFTPRKRKQTTRVAASMKGQGQVRGGQTPISYFLGRFGRCQPKYTYGKTTACL